MFYLKLTGLTAGSWALWWHWPLVSAILPPLFLSLVWVDETQRDLSVRLRRWKRTRGR